MIANYLSSDTNRKCLLIINYFLSVELSLQ